MDGWTDRRMNGESLDGGLWFSIKVNTFIHSFILTYVYQIYFIFDFDYDFSISVRSSVRLVHQRRVYFSCLSACLPACLSVCLGSLLSLSSYLISFVYNECRNVEMYE